MAHLFCRYYTLRQTVLVDSCAHSEQRQFLNFDVALVADEFTGSGFQDVGLLGDAVIEKSFMDVEPRAFSPERFIDWDLFVRRIKRTDMVVGEWEPVARAPSIKPAACSSATFRASLANTLPL